eukprot:TRINITY_DN49750_c0_g1_i1.p1 TRINITY_DN49750_c0_g1~~TRINITY_DN49750_c0_g1_i1.p1  ORF type:complete len:169 (-),score=20.26 TRINITY_DN49750_c0_g1_i1:115-621(-)
MRRFSRQCLLIFAALAAIVVRHVGLPQTLALCSKYDRGNAGSTLEVRSSLLARRAAGAADLPPPPRHYYQHMRGEPLGNAFWRQSTKDKWGEKAEGDAGQFDKDDMVEAQLTGSDDPGEGEWYSAQVMKYIGNGDWVVMWIDDLPNYEESPKASVVHTSLMRHIPSPV